jgi:2-methylcitrate dehydratase PrpD
MATDAAYELLQEHDIDPAEVEQVTVRVHPYVYRLVGHRFNIGEHLVVDVQFSLQYALTNVILYSGTLRLNTSVIQTCCDWWRRSRPLRIVACLNETI